MTDLKPCPFCGGKANYENDTGPGDEGFWEWIECEACGAKAHDVAAWDRRASRPVAISEEMVERARATWPQPWEEYNLGKALRRALTAALSAPAMGDQPVAWQVQGPDGEWGDTRADGIDQYRAHGFAVRPLYATPRPAVDAWRTVPVGLIEAMRQAGWSDTRSAAYVQMWRSMLRAAPTAPEGEQP